MRDANTYVLGNYTQSLRTYSIVINTIGATVSFGMFIFGLALLVKQRTMWKNSIFRIVLVVQIINCARLIFRTVITSVPLAGHVEYRIFTFLNYVLGILPLYLCVHCNMYLQLVVIHHVSPRKRFPRIASLTISILMAVVPQTVYLYLSPGQMGIEDYCHIPLIPTWRRLQIIIVTYDIFIFLPGVIGVISMSITGVYIVHTAHRVKKASQGSAVDYRTNDLLGISYNTDLLRKTLKTVAWFPVTPIISVWFNGILPIVRYYTGKPYMELEYINVSLFAVMAVILALAMVMNPCVRSYFSDRRLHKRHQELLASGISHRSSKSFG